MLRNPTALAFPLTLISAAAFAAGPGRERPPVPVKTALVTEATLAGRQFVPGTIRAAEDARIASEVPGKLRWVAEPGAEVKKGQVVARLDASRLKADQARQAAEVKRLRALVRLTRQSVERQERMDDRGLGVSSVLEQAQADLAMAEQNLAGARAALKLAEADVERTQIRAPFAGQIVERLAQRGEYPREGTPVVRLVATRRLEVWADAPLTSMERIDQGAELRVRSGSRALSAKLTAIVHSGSSTRRVASLRLELAEGSGLHVGAAVEVALPGRRAVKQTVVPRDAIVLREEGAHVLVIDNSMKAHRVPVELGLGEGNLIAVVGALRPGQTVVRRGAESLSDGDLVKIIEPEKTEG